MLCEKAFTANASQAEEVLKLAHEKEVFITEAIWTRYVPSRQMISDIIKEGKIGEVVSLTVDLGYPVSHVPRLRVKRNGRNERINQREDKRKGDYGRKRIMGNLRGISRT